MRPPAFPLGQQPVLEFEIVVQVQALQELTAKQFGRFAPASIPCQFQQNVEVYGHIRRGDKGRRLAVLLPAAGQDLGQVV
jgi:hypothetical protein